MKESSFTTINDEVTLVLYLGFKQKKKQKKKLPILVHWFQKTKSYLLMNERLQTVGACLSETLHGLITEHVWHVLFIDYRIKLPGWGSRQEAENNTVQSVTISHYELLHQRKPPDTACYMYSVGAALVKV